VNFTSLSNATLRASVVAQNRTSSATQMIRRRVADTKRERGEGVISAAIAVLVFAAIGAAMWVAYKALFDNASTKTTTEIDKIGGA
jgi:uncharacterized protein HemX